MNGREAETGQHVASTWLAGVSIVTPLSVRRVAGSDSLYHVLLHPQAQHTPPEAKQRQGSSGYGGPEEPGMRRGDSPVLLPEVGRVARSRSKSENSSGSVSKPPTAVEAKMLRSAPAWGLQLSLLHPRAQTKSAPAPGQPPQPSTGSQYLQCRCCWAWQVNLPKDLRRPGQGPRGQKMGVHWRGPHLDEEGGTAMSSPSSLDGC